jgi:hypothetical protein
VIYLCSWRTSLLEKVKIERIRTLVIDSNSVTDNFIPLSNWDDNKKLFIIQLSNDYKLLVGVVSRLPN